MFKCPACPLKRAERGKLTNTSWLRRTTLHILHMLSSSYGVRCAGEAGVTSQGLLKRKSTHGNTAISSSVGWAHASLTDLKLGFNSVTAPGKRKNEEIADTRPASPRTANTTTNNSISTLSSPAALFADRVSHSPSPPQALLFLRIYFIISRCIFKTLVEI